MTLGYYQFAPILRDPQGNTETIIAALDDSRAPAADLIVLPELAITGYALRDRAQAEALAEDPVHSDRVDALVALCERRGCHLVVGFAEADGDRVYNASLLLGPTGLVDVYRKIHLFDRETLLFDPGNRPTSVHEVGDARVGMMICFDWIFPETARCLALAGADVIAHPSNLVLSFCQDAMVTRCLENGVYAVTTNRYGTETSPEGELTFTGMSQITGPRGAVLGRAPNNADELVVVDIDPSEARDKKITPRNDRLGDRRPDLYPALGLRNVGDYPQ